MVDSIQDPRRSEPGFTLPEREMLEAWLEFHRLTLKIKCEGLTDEQRKARYVATSLLSLHGLVRHMANVEHWWFVMVLDRDLSGPRPYGDDDGPDADLSPLDDADYDADLAVFEASCATSREQAARRGLDDLGMHPHMGEVSLRWIYVHMIEEYARHNGHADLLRELADGAVGD